MALFLVLEDFSDGSATISAGEVIDDAAIDLPRLQASGLAALAYVPGTMEASRLAFLAARGSRVVEPDTSGDLMALLIAAGAVPTGVASVSAAAPLVASAAPNVTISIAPGTAAGDVVKWDGVQWTVGTPDVGITELTGDVLAGPGNGAQAATVARLQGYSVAAIAPSLDGQVLTWNGSDWVPGLPPAGGSGGGGQTYFFNNGTAGDAPLPAVGTKELGLSAEAPLTTVTSGILPNTGVYALVAGFVTDLNKPGLTAIPVGLWDFNVWANASGPSNAANIVRFRMKVYVWDGVTATLLATSGVVPLYDPSQVVQYSCSALVPQTVILATDRIYVEIEATATANNHTITVSFGDAAPTHVHTTLPSIAGTGLVHVINGVVQSPASAVNLAGGSAEVTGTLPIGNGGTGLATTPTSGQLLIGNGAGYTQATLTAGSGVTITNGAGSIAIAAAGGIGQYPAIDANTILAWNFAAAAGPFANLGTAGVGGDMVTIGAGVGRNVPGPINPGVQLTNAANNTVYTAQGPAANIGSASFTNQMTAMVVFELNVLPAHGGYQRLLWKGYVNAGWTAPFGSGVVMEFFNSNLDVNFFSAAGVRGNSNLSIAATTLYWNTRYHLLVATYDGTISRMYWDGEMVRLANFGSASNLQMGAPGNEGPWTLGGRYNLSANESINGKIYYARVDNVVRNDAWVRRAWADLNGWP